MDWFDRLTHHRRQHHGRGRLVQELVDDLGEAVDTIHELQREGELKDATIAELTEIVDRLTTPPARIPTRLIIHVSSPVPKD